MNDLTNQQLLRDYAERRSEAAFAELARRHVDLVYSAALRMVHDAHLAEDVTQGVFVALAQNAGQLAGHPVLSGWLHRTARNLAVKVVRSDVHRRAREQEAAVMNELLNAEPDAVWEQIGPLLDDALGELNDADRDALMLRYFEHKSAREMAQMLGTSEDAAQKRVSRAVERLRELFVKRGVTVGATGLVVVISANAVQTAPAGMTATLSTAGTLVGGTLSATTINSVAMTALQKVIVTGTVAVLAVVGVYEARQASRLRGQFQTLQQQQAPLAGQIQQLRSDLQDATNRLATLREENERLNRNSVELLRLRSRVASLQQRNQDLEKLTNFLAAANANSFAVNASNFVIPDMWTNAGLDTATAAVRTYLWAIANTNTAKLKEVLAPPAREKESFWEWLDKGALFLDKTVKGARIVEARKVGLLPDEGECLFKIEIMEESMATTETGEMFPMISLDPQSIVVRRINGIWQVVLPGNRELSPEEMAKSHAAAVERENLGLQP